MVDAEQFGGYLSAQWATGAFGPRSCGEDAPGPLCAVVATDCFGLLIMGAAPAEVTVNKNDDTEASSRTVSSSGFENLHLSDGDGAAKVTIGSMDRWDRSHLRRLRQSADLPGLVPIIDSDLSSDGKPFAVTPVVNNPRLSDQIPPAAAQWSECAAIVEASARSLHEAHLRGLFHGSLSPDQILVIDQDVAVEGVGLGLGGQVQADYAHWTAPEVQDGSDATERSDVYSLGKILEAALGNNIEDVPRSVRRLIMWSSSDTPEARPPSALEFASILAEALGDERTTFSPAFIPTTGVTALAGTASAEVAAHELSDISSGAGAATAVAAGSAAVGAAAVSQFMDDDDIEIDDPSAGLEVVDEDADVDLDADVHDDADLDLVDDDDIEIIEDDVDLQDEAVVTGEIPETDSEIAAEAATTTEVEADGEIAADVDADDFDSRDYTAATAAAVTTDETVPAAQTVDIITPQDRSGRSNRAGILVGVIAAAVLGLIGWQLLSGRSGGDEVATNPAAEQAADSEEDSEQSVSSEESEPETPTTQADASGDDETTEAAATEEEEPAEEEVAAEEEAAEEEAAEEEVAEEEPVELAEASAPLLDGTIGADDAALQIVHGIPGATVDIYVDGQALAPGFEPGTIAGPLELAPGDYQVDIFAASDAAPAASADRSDSPLLSETITAGASPATLYAHLGEQGAPMLTGFAEDFSVLAPGEGRAVARHLAAAPEVTLVVDGQPVGPLANGGYLTADLPAGSHTFAIEAGDAEVLAATLEIGDGEVVVVSVTGSAADGTLAPVVQRYDGLSSAPTEVPTGDSDLLGMDEDLTSLYLVGIVTLAMILGGLALSARRRQTL